MASLQSMMVISALALTLSAGVQAKAPSTPPAAATETTDKAAPMDINTASATDLATLPKIGEARAAAIVKGRPYTAKNELLEKKILPSDAYAAVKDKIIAKHAPMKK